MTRFDIITKCLENGFEDILNQVSTLSDADLLQHYEAELYPQRRIDGQKYSDMMGARLVILEAPEEAKKEISDLFASTQNYLVLGWWKSALRDVNMKVPNTYVSQEFIDELKTEFETYIAQSY